MDKGKMKERLEALNKAHADVVGLIKAHSEEIQKLITQKNAIEGAIAENKFYSDEPVEKKVESINSAPRKRKRGK